MVVVKVIEHVEDLGSWVEIRCQFAAHVELVKKIMADNQEYPATTSGTTISYTFITAKMVGELLSQQGVYVDRSQS